MRLGVSTLKWQMLYQTKAEPNTALSNMSAVVLLAVGNHTDACQLNRAGPVQLKAYVTC